MVGPQWHGFYPINHWILRIHGKFRPGTKKLQTTLEGGDFRRAIFSRWIEDVKRGVRVKTGEWKEVQMSRIWNWRQAPGSFVFCARRKSFVYIFWWLLHHATERGVVLSVTQQTLVLLYMDLVLSSSLYFIILIDIWEPLQQKPSMLGLTTPGHANCNLNRLKKIS